MLFAGWFHYHKAAPKLAWFQDVESMLNHHLAGLLGLGFRFGLNGKIKWAPNNASSQTKNYEISRRNSISGFAAITWVASHLTDLSESEEDLSSDHPEHEGAALDVRSAAKRRKRPKSYVRFRPALMMRSLLAELHTGKRKGSLPLWIIGTVAGILVISLVGVFFYGSYSGLGSSL
ncbi:hypothetical protein E3N88_36732 [Mikania micrantha]|uniref:Photosystem II reaction center protein J n=3 Tax=Mesangiospermae TaxID=1437183 RepID=A0A5N6M523_9ASTR|nr:hypothetical protein E3N88_36732 [Mikania micrantha]